MNQVLPENHAMLDLAHALGFTRRFSPEERTVEVRQALDR